MKGMKIGIDFGSSSLKMYAEDKGVVVDEPSIVAIDSTTGNPIAFGKAADNVNGRCLDDIVISKVIRNGIVSDFVMAERMLRYYLQRVCGNRIYKPNIILSLPSNISRLEGKIFLDAVTLAGAGRVCMVDGILASALGCRIPANSKKKRMVIDIGHHVTEYSIVSCGSIEFKGYVSRGSYEIDKAIINHLKKDRDILIGPHTAREIKNKLTSAVERKCETALFSSGKSYLDNMPISFEITSSEIFPFVDEQLESLVQEISNNISELPSDMIDDAKKHGIMICGGGALIFNIADRISKKFETSCDIIDEPRLARVNGLGKIMNNNELLVSNGYRFIFKDEISNRIKNIGV